MTQRRPTVLPPSPAAEAAPPPVAAPRAPTRLPSSLQPPAEPRAAGAPTRVQGEQRRGVEVEVPELQQRFPALGVDEAEAVQQVLRGAAPQAMTAREAAAWGQAPQQRYAALVERSLQLAQDPQRLAASQHVQRLHAMLEDVAEAIAAQLQPGLLNRFRAQPWELLAQQRAEIEQLRRALADATGVLERQLEETAAVRREMAGLAGTLQVHGLAASWLAEHRRPADAVAETLLQRATELTATQAHVAGAQLLREQAESDLRSLCACIRQAVLLLLPAWLEKALLAGRAAPTPTAARALQHELASVLALLRPH